MAFHFLPLPSPPPLPPSRIPGHIPVHPSRISRISGHILVHPSRISRISGHILVHYRELGSLMRDMGERLSAGETAAYFKSLDANDDNVVDFAELYVSFLLLLSGGS